MKYLTLFCITTLFCCTKPKEEICFKTFLFDIPLSVTPQLDTFRIGDTIWLTSQISNNIEDLNGSELINVEDFDFKVRIAFSRFDVDEFNVAEQHFEFINQIGSLNQTSQVNTNVVFEDNENSQALSIGIVPLTDGGFNFSFYNLRVDLQKVSLIDTSCFQTIDLNYNMNDGENNLHLIQENVGIDKDTPIENLQKHGTYAFWVVE